jgi:hypothetical protein
MTTEKTPKAEEEYFAKEEAEKKKRLQEKLKEELEKERRASTRDIWFLTCPKCGAKLEEMVFRGVKIDKCHECGGVWLDAGELETLAGPEGHSVISEILKLFKPGAPKG